LQDEADRTAYFPDENGHFNLHSVDIPRFATLLVEGPGLQTSQSRPNSSLTLSSMQTTSHDTASLPPPSRSVVAPKKGAVYSLKIIQARMIKSRGKKPEFHSLSQLYTDIGESTANVDYILTVVQRRWGEDYTLVTSDGLELHESSGTRGMCTSIIDHVY